MCHRGHSPMMKIAKYASFNRTSLRGLTRDARLPSGNFVVINVNLRTIIAFNACAMYIEMPFGERDYDM